MIVSITACCLAFCCSLVIPQDSQPPPPLAVGQKIEAELAGESAAYLLQVNKTGPFVIELRSYFFDAYLVLRDAGGAVIAEDDNGLLRTQARIVVDELNAGAAYTVEVRASKQGVGGFEIIVKPGKPGELTRDESLMASLSDISHGLKVVGAALGETHASLLPLLDEFGLLFEKGGWYFDALDTYERALAIRRELLGDEDAEDGRADERGRADTQGAGESGPGTRTA